MESFGMEKIGMFESMTINPIKSFGTKKLNVILKETKTWLNICLKMDGTFYDFGVNKFKKIYLHVLKKLKQQ